MPENAPQLRDIHVPQISAWWPLAPAWWVLMAMVVVVLIALAVMWRRRAAWRRHVDVVLEDVRAASRRYTDDHDGSAFAARASQLLRRVARTRDPRSVTLAGDAWRDALAAMAPNQDVTRLVALDAALYQRNPDMDVTATTRDIEAWVRTALQRRAKTHVAS